MYVYVYMYMYRPLRGFDPRAKVTGGTKHASQTYGSFPGRRVKGTAGSNDRPIPMRKANPAFCDRSKSHKKLDPFDDRKMVYWLAENPFLVRSSAISASVSVHRIPLHARVRTCARPIHGFCAVRLVRLLRR